LLLLFGCTTVQEPAPVESPAVPPAAPAVKQENIAIAGLMDSARNDAAAGKLGSAAATLERALRIEPRNPRLWHELARIRLRQADYPQAESTAARSNTYAGTDAELRAANQKIISDARAARGR
jgi:cytochrome c-type biogenesis protein CcmH/NrfG